MTTDFETNTESNQLSAAEKYYLSHKKRMSDYQKRNKDKIKEKNKNYLEKIKENPERREQYLEKKRDYYIRVTKPKLEALKKQTEDEPK